MKLVYRGPHPEVVVDELDQEQVITAGEPVEIPDELAARLLEQNTWSRDVSDVSRSELNSQAQAAGVEDPHKLPNKEAVVEAISAAASPEPDPAPAEETTNPPAEADDKKGDSE